MLTVPLNRYLGRTKSGVFGLFYVPTKEARRLIFERALKRERDHSTAVGSMGFFAACRSSGGA